MILLFDIEQFMRQMLKETSRQLDEANPAAGDNGILAIVTGGTAGSEEGLDSLRLLKAKGYRITLIASPAAQSVLGCEHIAARSEAQRCIWDPSREWVEQLLRSHRQLAIPVLTASSAAKLATGCWDTLTTYLTYQALMMGWRVVAAKDAALPSAPYGKLPISPNAAIVKMLAAHLHALEQMGVQLTAAAQLAEHFPVYAAAEPGRPASFAGGSGSCHELHWSGKLLSQADLHKLEPSVRTVLLGSGTVVTPMAKDYANSRGITLNYTGFKTDSNRTQYGLKPKG